MLIHHGIEMAAEPNPYISEFRLIPWIPESPKFFRQYLSIPLKYLALLET